MTVAAVALALSGCAVRTDSARPSHQPAMHAVAAQLPTGSLARCRGPRVVAVATEGTARCARVGKPNPKPKPSHGAGGRRGRHNPQPAPKGSW